MAGSGQVGLPDHLKISSWGVTFPEGTLGSGGKHSVGLRGRMPLWGWGSFQTQGARFPYSCFTTNSLWDNGPWFPHL